MPRVEISNGGRAGSITYREGLHSASFDWEFALSPALAIIAGPKSGDWDRACPWAAGRQAEVFAHVAGEVVRQKAPDCTPEIDLAAGTITLVEPRSAPGRKRRGTSPRGPLDALGELEDDELEALTDLILTEGMSGRAVDALAQIDRPRARAAVEEAARDHLSVDIRLAGAEALYARGALADLDAVLAREIRALNRTSDGLARALRLSEAHPTELVKQALLWASWNQTECAPDCARLLLRLAGGAEAVAAMSAVLPDLGLHRSYFERKAAFDALCHELGMTLEPG